MNFKCTPFVSLSSLLRAERDNTAMLDVTYRAYDLDKLTGHNTVKKALSLLGRNSVTELSDDMRCIDLLPGDGITGAMCRWYVWYRLCRGEIGRWPLRKDRANPVSPDPGRAAIAGDQDDSSDR